MTPPENVTDAERVRQLMNVTSVGRDLPAALALAEGSEEPECEYLRALFMYTGTCVQQDRVTAAEVLREAGAKGFVPAKIVADEIEANPEDVEAPLVERRLRAEMGDTAACRELFPLYDTGKNADGTKAPVRKSHVEAVRLYTPCAEAGDSDAQNVIGYMYLMGKGVEKDREKAERYLTEAAEHGNAQAACRLAVMYDQGQCGVPASLDKALPWYVKSADEGYADAQYALAGIYFMQDTKYFDLKAAQRYIGKAADNGHPDAMHQLGLMYCYGSNGFRRDTDKGVKYLLGACGKDVVQAMVDYANMRFDGQVLPRDMDEAAKWFSAAADRGDGIAQYATGVMYANGYHYKPDDETAFRYFTDAAEGGEPNAQYALGCFYYEGRGTEQDDRQAWSWFQESAEQGHPSAKCFVAMFKVAGKETPQDIEGGLKMLEDMASDDRLGVDGYPEAQYYLGKIYHEGVLVKRDDAYAKKMLTRAAKQGDPDAKAMLADMKKRRRRDEQQDREGRQGRQRLRHAGTGVHVPDREGRRPGPGPRRRVVQEVRRQGLRQGQVGARQDLPRRRRRRAGPRQVPLLPGAGRRGRHPRGREGALRPLLLRQPGREGHRHGNEVAQGGRGQARPALHVPPRRVLQARFQRGVPPGPGRGPIRRRGEHRRRGAAVQDRDELRVRARRGHRGHEGGRGVVRQVGPHGLRPRDVLPQEAEGRGGVRAARHHRGEEGDAQEAPVLRGGVPHALDGREGRLAAGAGGGGGCRGRLRAGRGPREHRRPADAGADVPRRRRRQEERPHSLRLPREGRHGRIDGRPAHAREGVRVRKADRQGHGGGQALLRHVRGRREPDRVLRAHPLRRQAGGVRPRHPEDREAMGFKEVMDKASSGDPRAQCAIGYIYYTGDGTAVDYNRAFVWFDLAAQQGDPEGECNAAYMLVHAQGTNANLDEALRMYEDSASKGYVQAQFNLAHMYSDGLGVDQDWSKAIEWYTRASDGGSVPACYRLGVIYEEGRGTDADPERAAGLYSRCAGAGHVKSMVRLGRMTLEGRGVRKNPGAASKLFVKAAAEGDAEAMLWLGKMSISGEGMVKSAGNARKWLSKSATRGNEEARALLETLK